MIDLQYLTGGENMKKSRGEKLRPLAFRLYESERQALRQLAHKWQTSQVGVIRRLLAIAETERGEERKDERTK